MVENMLENQNDKTCLININNRDDKLTFQVNNLKHQMKTVEDYSSLSCCRCVFHSGESQAVMDGDGVSESA